MPIPYPEVMENEGFPKSQSGVVESKDKQRIDIQAKARNVQVIT